jgi:Bacterial membrane protein YfhO
MTSFARFASWNNSNVSRDGVRDFFKTGPPPFGTPFQASGGVDRWATDTYAYRSISLIKSIEGINAFDPMMQRDWSKIAGGMLYDGWQTREDFWNGSWINDILRVTTLALAKERTPAGTGWTFDRSVDNSDMKRWIRTPVLPEAYLVDHIAIGSLDQIQAAINNPSSDFRRGAFVEDPKHVNDPAFFTATTPITEAINASNTGNTSNTSNTSNTGNTSNNEPNDGQNVRPNGDLPGKVISSDLTDAPRAVIEVQRKALLVLSAAWSDGWSARIDGKHAQVYRTNGIVMGVAVPPGKHNVRLVFDPPGYRAGTLLSVASLLGLLANPVLAKMKRRRRT